jgi:AcrR family transcriptional regulator
MPTATRKRFVEKTRLGESDWVDAATDLLVKQSVEKVRVEPLALHLKVTKGSFYWHFRDRAALLKAVLARWQDRSTYNLRERLQRENPDADERLLRYLSLPQNSDTATAAAEIELAIRAWARRSTMARQAVENVDAVRVEAFIDIFRELGASPSFARPLAHTAYAVMRYLGQSPHIATDERRTIIAAAHGTLVAAARKR